MTIQVPSAKHVPSRAIARQLGVAESTVRYHLQRSREGAVDGRKGKPFAAEAFEPAIDAWRAGHGDVDRPINVRDIFDHLVRSRGCPTMGRPQLAEETWRAAVVPVARAWQSQGGARGDRAYSRP